MVAVDKVDRHMDKVNDHHCRCPRKYVLAENLPSHWSPGAGGAGVPR